MKRTDHTPPPSPPDDPASLLPPCDRPDCPSIDAIERHARSPHLAPPHLAPSGQPTLPAGCQRCAARAAIVRANDALLGEFRALIAEQPPPHANPSPDQPPDLPGYTIHEPISAGGQATVYRATHHASARAVAIKVMHGLAHDPDADPTLHAEHIHRIERELRILARFRHPGIVTVHDGGRTTDGLPYIVMELVEGGTLRQHAHDSPFHHTPERIRAAAVLLRQVAAAVGAAHRSGLIHRDLKPANILIDDAGQPKVADFGIAREPDHATTHRAPADATDSAPAHAQPFLGSIAYAAPEQFDPSARHALDGRVDVFSLGLILRELVTGSRLRRDPLRRADVPSARTEHPLVHHDLDRIIARATAIDPRDRYPSADALADDLGRWLDRYPIEQRRGERFHVAAMFARRHPFASASAAAFLLVLLAYAATITGAAAIIRSKNIDLQRRLVEREAVMSAISEPLAALDTDSSLESVRDINELLGRAAQAIDQHLGDEPTLQSRLLSSVGLALLYRRELDAAESCLRRANEIENARAAASTPEQAEQRNLRLAETLHDLGRLSWHRAAAARSAGDGHAASEHQQHSIERYEHAHQLRAAILPTDHDDLALTMSHLGASYSAMGRFDEADRLFEQVLAVREATAATQPLELVRTLMSIGSHRYRAGDLAGSEAAYERAESVARRAGPGLPLAAAINARGLLLLELNEPERARDRFEEAAELRRSLLGPFDPDSLASRRDMAHALLEANRPAEAHAIATAVLQSIESAGPRAKASERAARFVVAAAEARMRPGQPPPTALIELWHDLAAIPRAADRTDRRIERLRASVAIELAASMIAHQHNADAQRASQPTPPSPQPEELCREALQDLASLTPSPRRQRDAQRAAALHPAATDPSQPSKANNAAGSR